MFNKLFNKKQDTSNEIWLKYYDKTNSNEILLEKSNDLALVFPEFVKGDFIGVTDYLKKDNILVDEKKLEAIFKDICFYNIHLLSRLSQGYLPYAQYDLFINNFQKKLRPFISEILGGTDEVNYFINESNDFEIEYSSYRPYTPDLNGMAGVINWEFAKRISKNLPDEARTTFMLVYSAIFIAPTFTNLQIPELLLGKRIRTA